MRRLSLDVEGLPGALVDVGEWIGGGDGRGGEGGEVGVAQGGEGIDVGAVVVQALGGTQGGGPDTGDLVGGFGVANEGGAGPRSASDGVGEGVVEDGLAFDVGEPAGFAVEAGENAHGADVTQGGDQGVAVIVALGEDVGVTIPGRTRPAGAR